MIDTPERLQLRKTVRRFVEAEVLPYLDDWEKIGELPREPHRKAGEVGLLGVSFPENGGGTNEILAGLAAKRLGYTS